MERQKAFAEAYQESVPVQKLKAGARRVFVTDKDGTIQRQPSPVAHQSQSEISAGKEIRRITAECPFIISSAQVLELTIDSGRYQTSVGYGFNRPPPHIFLPDGTRTNKPETVHGWEYLLNPDAFVGFGSGIQVLWGDGYTCDWEYDVALGGPAWRPGVLKELEGLYTTGNFKEHLGLVDRDGLYETGGVNVAPLAYRVQFDHYFKEGSEGCRDRQQLLLGVLAQQTKGRFQNVALVDESSPAKGRYTTYLVSKYGQKEMGLERFGNQLSFHSGVPMSELEFVSAGDSPTDLVGILDAFRGAKEVLGIIAGKSRLSESIQKNEDTFAGVPLPGSPNHPTLPGHYIPTATPGVYWWKGTDRPRPRKVILADYAPWSKGLECTESVLACLDHLGFK